MSITLKSNPINQPLRLQISHQIKRAILLPPSRFDIIVVVIQLRRWIGDTSVLEGFGDVVRPDLGVEYGGAESAVFVESLSIVFRVLEGGL